MTIDQLMAAMKRSTDPAQGTGGHFLPHRNELVTYTNTDREVAIVHKVSVYYIDHTPVEMKILVGNSLRATEVEVLSFENINEALAGIEVYRKIS